MPKLRGLSLLEVLIALTLLSFALLGFDALNILALRHSRENTFYYTAVIQMQNINERLSVLGQFSDKTPAILQWNQENKTLLPKGRGVVSGSYPIYFVTLYWGNSAQSSCATFKLGSSGCIASLIKV